MNITDREYAAMEICLNYNDRETQLIDNFSNGGFAEFMSELGLSRHQAAQLCGSLEEKGLGVNDGNQGNGHIMWLTDAGVHAIFDRRESL
jgi:hypothetical protein